MGPNKELCGLVRCFRIYLREKAKLEITTESPLLPNPRPLRCETRRNNGILQNQRTRIHSWREAMLYKLPKTADLTKLDDRWRTAIWLGKSDRSKEHVIGLETGAVLARSVRQKVEGKRWNEKALKMVTSTPWHPRPREWCDEGTSRERWSNDTVRPKTSVDASRKSQHHSERCRAQI